MSFTRSESQNVVTIVGDDRRELEEQLNVEREDGWESGPIFPCGSGSDWPVSRREKLYLVTLTRSASPV